MEYSVCGPVAPTYLSHLGDFPYLALSKCYVYSGSRKPIYTSRYSPFEVNPFSTSQNREEPDAFLSSAL